MSDDASVWSFDGKDESDTDRVGLWLARALPDTAAISLRGTLGAGKTRLVQALASAAGIDRRDVLSPTFVLCQTYRGRQTIHHLDAYRVRDDDEFLELGVAELLAEPATWTVVEWGERVERCLPVETIQIDLQVLGETGRRFIIHAPQQPELIKRLRAIAESS